MNYSQYVTAIGDLLQYAVVDATSATPFSSTDANNILPSIITYAELKMYRDFDFISTIVSPTAVTVSGSRNVTIPASIIVLQSVNLITPAATAPDSGTRNPLQRVSIEYMNYTWPNVATTGQPVQYALNQSTLTTGANPDIRIAPTPAAIYQVECLGTARPATLSSSNTSTFLTINLPDLFIIASMIFAAGYQRDYGAQSDDPQLASSWEQQYKTLKDGAMVEELRKKAQSTAWQPYLPSPIATPPRQ